MRTRTDNISTYQTTDIAIELTLTEAHVLGTALARLDGKTVRGRRWQSLGGDLLTARLHLHADQVREVVETVEASNQPSQKLPPILEALRAACDQADMDGNKQGVWVPRCQAPTDGMTDKDNNTDRKETSK